VSVVSRFEPETYRREVLATIYLLTFWWITSLGEKK